MTDHAAPPEPLHPERLTWAVLLGRWVDFARTALALPDAEGEEAGRVRASVADIIALQAVCFAMRQLDELDHEQRSLGIDRAGVLVERHGGAIRRRWATDAMPEALAELLHEARAAWEEADASTAPHEPRRR